MIITVSPSSLTRFFAAVLTLISSAAFLFSSSGNISSSTNTLFDTVTSFSGISGTSGLIIITVSGTISSVTISILMLPVFIPFRKMSTVKLPVALLPSFTPSGSDRLYIDGDILRCPIISL